MSERQARLPEVAVAGARIDLIAAATEQRRRAPILLYPERQQQPRPGAAETVRRGRQDDPREHRRLDAHGLVMNEAVFDSELEVAAARAPAGAVGMRIS